MLGPPVLQVASQPGEAFDVEVVRWFVEGNEVPLTDQQCGAGNPAALSAGERSDGPALAFALTCAATRLRSRVPPWPSRLKEES